MEYVVEKSCCTYIHTRIEIMVVIHMGMYRHRLVSVQVSFREQSMINDWRHLTPDRHRFSIQSVHKESSPIAVQQLLTPGDWSTRHLFIFPFLYSFLVPFLLIFFFSLKKFLTACFLFLDQISPSPLSHWFMAYFVNTATTHPRDTKSLGVIELDSSSEPGGTIIVIINRTRRPEREKHEIEREKINESSKLNITEIDTRQKKKKNKRSPITILLTNNRFWDMKVLFLMNIVG